MENNKINCFNCSKAIPEFCKADCCGVVPIRKSAFEILNYKIVTKPVEVIELELNKVNYIFPITENGFCCFLTKNFGCNIYNHRPQICRDFGNIPELPCPYISVEGNLRSTGERVAIINETAKKNKELFKILGANNG